MALTQQRSSFNSILYHSHSYFICWILYIKSHKLSSGGKTNVFLEFMCLWPERSVTFNANYPKHTFVASSNHLYFIARNKSVICCLRSIKAQTNRLASRSVQFGRLPLLFIHPPVSYLNLLPANFNVQASSCTVCFGPYMVTNPKYRFSRGKANFMNGIVFLVQTFILICS